MIDKVVDVRGRYRPTQISLTHENALSMHRSFDIDHFMQKYSISMIDRDQHMVYFDLTSWINLAPRLSPWCYQNLERGAWAWFVEPHQRDCVILFEHVEDLVKFKLTWM